jgi:hypothetical protein
VINTIGQVVMVKESTLTPGANVISLEVKELAAGVYNVVIDSDAGSSTKKLTITK